MTKKKLFLFIILSLVALSVLSLSCKKQVPAKKIRRLENPQVFVQKKNVYRANMVTIKESPAVEKELQSMIEEFLKISFLDLNNKKNKTRILNYFNDEIRNQAEIDFDEITLGKTASKIDSIINAKIFIDKMSVVWDLQNKPVLGQADFKIENLAYRAGNTKVTGMVKGNLLLTKEKQGFKILDYSIDQNIQSKAGNKNQ